MRRGRPARATARAIDPAAAMWLSLISTCSPGTSGGCRSRRSGRRISRARGSRASFCGCRPRARRCRRRGRRTSSPGSRSRQSLQEVERRALGGQQRRRRAFDPKHLGARPDPRPSAATIRVFSSGSTRVKTRAATSAPHTTRSCAAAMWRGSGGSRQTARGWSHRQPRVLLQGKVDQMVSPWEQVQTSFQCTGPRGRLTSGSRVTIWSGRGAASASRILARELSFM